MNDKTMGRAPAGVYVAGIFVFILFATVALGVFFQSFLPERVRPDIVVGPHGMMTLDFRAALEFRENLGLANLFLTTFNIVLLVYLLLTYVQIWLPLRSTFSAGLLVMVSALLAHAIAASPIVHQLFGFRGSGLGPFTLLPSIFTLVAALVLVYLSRQ